MTTFRRRLLLAAAVTVAACALLGGCGNETNESSEPTPSREPATPQDESATVEGSGFSVDMPAKPKRKTGTVQTPKGPVKLTLYAVVRGDEAYLMSVGEMPPGVEPDLDGAVQGAATNVHGTVAERTSSQYQGLPARDARITDAEDEDGNKATVFLRVVGEDDRYYLLEYIAKGSDVRTAASDYQPFLDSLKIEAPG
jgi:hypothetical protein